MIYTKENFTIGDLLEAVKDCSEDALLLNSNYYEKHTDDNLNNPSLFEPIMGVYDEKSHAVADFSWKDGYSKAMTLREFKKLKLPQHYSIERDVEDGFRYSNYDSIVFNEKFIVIC